MPACCRVLKIASPNHEAGEHGRGRKERKKYQKKAADAQDLVQREEYGRRLADGLLRACMLSHDGCRTQCESLLDGAGKKPRKMGTQQGIDRRRGSCPQESPRNGTLQSPIPPEQTICGGFLDAETLHAFDTRDLIPRRDEDPGKRAHRQRDEGNAAWSLGPLSAAGPAMCIGTNSQDAGCG